KSWEPRCPKVSQLLTKLVQDAADGIKGVHERLDIMFLQALSTGVTLINDSNNTGTGVRVDFGIPAGNQFGVTKVWTDSAATPIDDIENVTGKAGAKGHSLKSIWMAKVTFHAFTANTQVKNAYAGHLTTNASDIFRVRRA